MGTSWWFLILGMWMLLASFSANAEIQELSFADAEAATTKQQLVFFSSGKNAKLLGMLDEISSFSDAFIYAYVDCEADHSKQKCKSASFTKENLPRVFLNSVEGGIESISGPPEKEAILNFLEFRSSLVAGERVIFAESQTFYKEIMGKGRHVVVKFYQTWCSHCKRYKKHFEQSSTLFGSSAPVEVLFLEVDCSSLEQVCRNNGVSSYPTIKFYDANNDMQQSPVKARDHQELTEFLNEHAHPLKQDTKVDGTTQAPDMSALADDELYQTAIEKANANELDDTVLYFRELQKRNPRDPQRNSNLGTALMRKGNGPAGYPADFLIPYEEAMKYFSIALELDSTSAAAMEGMSALVGNIRYRGQQSGVSEAEIETIIRRAQRRNGLNPKPGLYHGDADSDEWEEDDDWDSEEEEDDWGDDASIDASDNDDDWDDDEDWTDEL